MLKIIQYVIPVVFLSIIVSVILFLINGGYYFKEVFIGLLILDLIIVLCKKAAKGTEEAFKEIKPKKIYPPITVEEPEFSKFKLK